MLALTPALLPTIITPFDLKRLDAYGNNALDYHVVLDLLPTIANVFFQRRLGAAGDNELHLSAVQSAILLGIGLQRKTVEDVEVTTLLFQDPCKADFQAIIDRTIPSGFTGPRASCQSCEEALQAFGRRSEGRCYSRDG